MMKRYVFPTAARQLPNGKATYLIGQSRGNTSQCEYIGRSLEQNWFHWVVLRSMLLGRMSVRLVVGHCKGHPRTHPFELGGMYSFIVKPRSRYIILMYSFAFTLFNFE